jgi:hypothetical protein
MGVLEYWTAILVIVPNFEQEKERDTSYIAVDSEFCYYRHVFYKEVKGNCKITIK